MRGVARKQARKRESKAGSETEGIKGGRFGPASHSAF